METPKNQATRRGSRTSPTPLLDSYAENMQATGDKQTRRPTDELRRQLSFTPPSVRRNSSVISNNSNTTVSLVSGGGMDPEEVDEMLKNCLELARKNHLNERNVWDLHLIDHLTELQKPEGGNKGIVNFEKASAGLGAAVQIYSKRVDSALTQAFDAMNRMSKVVKTKGAKGQDNEEEVLDEEGEEVPVTQERSQRTAQRRVRKRAATLAPEESITQKACGVELRDYLFEKSCAEFDERGFNGMMVAKGGVCRGLEMVIDLNDTKEGPPNIDPAHRMMDVAGLLDIDAPMSESFLPELLGEIQSLLGPSRAPDINGNFKAVINDAVDALDKRPMQHFADVAMDAPAEPVDITCPPEGVDFDPASMPDFTFAGPDEFDDDDDGRSLHGHTFPDPPMEEGTGMDLDFGDQDNNIGGPDFGDIGDGGAPPEMGEPQDQRDIDNEGHGISEEELKKMLEHLQSAPVGKRAARSSHWKYNQPGKASETKNHRKRQKRKKLDLDFTDLPEVDLEEELKLPAKESQLVKRSRNQAPCPLRPKDAHLKPVFLAQVSFHPGIGGVGKDRNSRSAANLMNQDELDSFEVDDGYGFDGFDAGCPDLGAVSFDGPNEEALDGFGSCGDDGLVLEPPKVKETVIKLPKYARQVNMDALKGLMWEEIQQLHLSNPSDTVSFQDVLYAMPEESPAGYKEDISVQICFVALLHLANEHGLEVTNSASLSEVDIKLE